MTPEELRQAECGEYPQGRLSVHDELIRFVPEQDIFFEDSLPLTAVLACSVCPIRIECLTDALDRGEPHGIWGGASTRDRNKLNKLRRRLKLSAKDTALFFDMRHKLEKVKNRARKLIERKIREDAKNAEE